MKKLTCFVLAVLLASAALWAGAQREDAGAKEITLSTPGVYPIVSEPITLDFVVPMKTNIIDYATHEFTKLMEEMTGIRVNYTTIPENEEAISLSLASGEYPDVYFLSWERISEAQLEQYGIEEGVFQPLEELIRERAPNAVKAIEMVPNGWGLSRSTDGQIYSMPRIDVCQHCEHASKMWVNHVWLDALGLDTPTTTDEFYEMLKAFKTQDPNGNGKDDEIPLAGAIKGWHAIVEQFLMNSFVYYDAGNYGYYIENGLVRNALNQAEYKEGLRYLRKLYSEGLIYPGSFTQDDQVLKKIFNNEEAAIVGAVPAGGPFVYAGVIGDERARTMRPIAPLKGPKGVRISPRVHYPITLGNMVITKENKYPEATVQCADWLYTLEGSLWIRWGAEGKGWRWPQAGEVGYDGGDALWAELMGWGAMVNEPQNHCMIDIGVYNFDDVFRPGMATDITGDIWSAKANERMLYVVTKDLYKPYNRNDMALPPVKFTAMEQTEVATLKTEMEKYADRSQFDFITGNLDIDADWDRYLSGLEKAGLSRLQNFYQTAYDRQFK